MSSDENSPSDTEENNNGLSLVRRSSPAALMNRDRDREPPLIHFLKCPECSFITTQKRRFESHFPCALHDEPTRYFLYICHLCRGMCTDRGIMEEHKETYHKGSQVNILEQQEVIKPLSMRNGTHSLSPGKPGNLTTNNNNNNISGLSGQPAAPTPVHATPPGGHVASSHRFLFSQPIACPVCKVICMGGADELVSHLQHAHSHELAGGGGASRTRSPPSHHFSSGGGQTPTGLGFQPTSMALSQCFGGPASLTSSGLVQQAHNWGSAPLTSSAAIGGGSNGLHPCSICQAVFRTSRQLETHMTVHPAAGNGSAGDPASVAAVAAAAAATGIPPALHQLQAAIMQAAAADSSKVSPLHLAHLSKMVAPPQPPTGDDLSPPESKRLRIHEGHLNISPSSHPASNGLSQLGGSRLGNTTAPPGGVSLHHNAAGAANGGCRSPGVGGSVSPTGPVENSVVHNTLRKTKSDIKVIRRYLLHVKSEQREIHTLPPEELAAYLQDFVLTARKKDGHEYEPESLKAFIHSLERHLKYHNYPASVLKDTTFATTRTILHQRLLELRAMSRVVGSGSKTSQSMTTQELIQAGVLGADNPQALLNTLWLFNRTYFNIGGTQRHKNLVWGQFQVVTSAEGEDYLQYTPNFAHEETRFFKGGVNSNNPDQLPLDCVEIFRIYANMRPMEARGLQDAFYLTPDQAWEQGGSWFKSASAGVQLISKVPKLIGLKGRGNSGGGGSKGSGGHRGGGVGLGDEADESRTGDSGPDSPLDDDALMVMLKSEADDDEEDPDEQEEAVDMTSSSSGVGLQLVVS